MQLTHPGVQPFLPLSRAHGSDECRSLPYPAPRLAIRWTRGPEGHDALVIRWTLHISNGVNDVEPSKLFADLNAKYRATLHPHLCFLSQKSSWLY